MSSNVIINVEDVSKCYPIYKKSQDRLKDLIFTPLRQYFCMHQVQYYHEFWAIRNINFSVYKGESFGIIGRNGSGKSTLLQLICGTLAFSTGKITTNGRIAALLELGTGYNHEFTGRENVYINAALLGFSKDEINERFESSKGSRVSLPKHESTRGLDAHL